MMNGDTMVEMKTLQDALKVFDDCDVYDNTFDDGIAWCNSESYYNEDDHCFKCAVEMAKRIDLVKINKAQYGVELVADIAKFVMEHMEFMYKLSQNFRDPMPDADPENDESVYQGVRIVNAMQAGYACDDEYNAMLKELGVE